MRHTSLLSLALLSASATFAVQSGADESFRQMMVNLGLEAEKASVAVFDATRILEAACTNIVLCGEDAYRTSRCFYSMNGLVQADSSVCDLSAERRLRMLTMAKCAAAVYADGLMPTGYAEPPHGWTQKLFANLGGVNHPKWAKDGRIIFESGMCARIMRGGADELIVAFAGVETENDGRIKTALSAILSGESKGQLNDGAMLLKTVLDIHDGCVAVTGHSFGGLLAVYAVASQKGNRCAECFLFNPLGVPYELLRSMDVVRLQMAAETMTTIQHPRDFARFLPGRHPGKVFLLPEENGIEMGKAHSIQHVVAVLYALWRKDRGT